MNRKVKKLFRTLQTYFPYLQDTKYTLTRWRGNVLKRPFEQDFQALSLFPDLENALYLDVGANRGQSADAILMKTQHSRIHMFEPNPLLYNKLVRYLGNNNRVCIHNFGLSDSNGEFELHVPFYRGYMFDGLASFDEENARTALDNRLFGYKQQHLVIKKITCKVKRLDELQLNPFFIKMDIQGHEFHALMGGSETIRTNEPVLLIEVPDSKITGYLHSLGYRPYAFSEGKFIPDTNGRINTFFMTESKSRLVQSHN